MFKNQITRTMLILFATAAFLLSFTVGSAAEITEPETDTNSEYIVPVNVIPASIPFGLWSLDDEAESLWGEKYSGATIWTSPKKIISLLDQAQAKGMRVVISLAGYGKSDFQNADDSFSFSLWKAEVDRYTGINLDKFINDGTIIAHYLIDEPKSQSNWGGDMIPNDIIDKMARYSKMRWPNMATTVRVTPSDLAEHADGYQVPLPGWKWQFLDTAWLQYSSRKGPINDYIAAESQSAQKQGLGLIVGLNAITGGDGSSGKPSPSKYEGKWTMSPKELLAYGTPLLDSNIACAFLIWSYRFDNDSSYNYTYFNLPKIDAALATLKQLADESSQQSCSPKLSNPLISDGFEKGDFSAWDKAKKANGDLKVCPEASINGNYGMCVTNKSNNKTKFVVDTGLYETTYNMQFNLDPNSMQLPNKKIIRVFLAKMGKRSTYWLHLRKFDGTFQVKAIVKLDNGTKSKTGWTSISNAAHLIEVNWGAATGSDKNDGYLKLYIDDVLKKKLTKLDNYTYRVRQIRLGFTNNPSKIPVSAVFYIDDFVSGNGAHIGP